MAIKYGGGWSYRWIIILCIASFCMGLLFTNRMWILPGTKSLAHLSSDECDSRSKPFEELGMLPGDVLETGEATGSISDAEMELEALRASEAKEPDGSPAPDVLDWNGSPSQRRKVFVVIGINTAFSSRKRRDSVRQTWMPRGEKLKKLEEEKGIVIRFVIGHGSTSGGILDRAIEAEDLQHHDFMRLEHIEGYHELSAKTKMYFATAVSMWDAEYYIKVDDDVHVNLGALGATLARHRTKPRVYIGCMKSGPVLAQKNVHEIVMEPSERLIHIFHRGVKYHEAVKEGRLCHYVDMFHRGVRYYEPEHWKFGEQGNKYFRHATGQLYALSHDLAVYISRNLNILHKYANEDVSLGAWFIGLDIDHVDDRRMCCGTPPDCEWKLQAGHACVASFDWACSGICKSAERMGNIHQRCGEGKRALWNAVF